MGSIQSLGHSISAIAPLCPTLGRRFIFSYKDCLKVVKMAEDMPFGLTEDVDSNNSQME